MWFCCKTRESEGSSSSDGHYYMENGGVLLEKLVASFNGNCNHIRFLSEKEVKLATNKYHWDRLVYDGLYYRLYKGILGDRQVLVKTSEHGYQSSFYMNEIAFASRMSNHSNILKLLGCCIESAETKLVYEFPTNGLLYHQLFGKFNDYDFVGCQLPWGKRLRIATEVANALAYIHYSTSRVIIHGYVSTNCVFLDQDLAAKLSDFRFAKLIPDGENHVDAHRHGLSMFVAPESKRTYQFTERSDVYSFGAMLFEILTEKKAGVITVHWKPEVLVDDESSPSWEMETDRSLEADKVNEYYLKANVLRQGNRNQIMQCADLALWCIKMNPLQRPTMKEVAQALMTITRTQIC